MLQWVCYTSNIFLVKTLGREKKETVCIYANDYNFQMLQVILFVISALPLHVS